MNIVLATLQILLVLLCAPLLQGCIKSAKARLQNRQGPSPLQPYRDIMKLLARQSVVSEQASWIFRAAPAVYAAALIAAAMLVPTLARQSAVPAMGDIIVFVGLMALARFVLAIAALDTGSHFGGMGASREVTFAALVEPALLLTLFAVALPAGSLAFSAIVGSGAPAPADVLLFGALMIVAIVETGRIPIDNPDTHLELTMIHEGMLLEYSGRPLGILHWATQIKQLTMLALISALFFPWGMAEGVGVDLLVALPLFLLKIALLGILLAVIETAYAKLRIFKAPDLIGLASVLGVIAVMTTYVVGG